MAPAKRGNTVTVHYTGKFDDGEVFDTSRDRSPLQFTIGEGSVLPGFERAVVGMNPGENKTIILSADEAYGTRDENLLFTIEKSFFPKGQEPKVGQFWQVEKDNGQVVNVIVAAISDKAVTLDANHPLAGKALTFDIELVTIV